MQLQAFEQAAGRIKGVIHETALSSSRTFSEMAGAELYLKCENLQKTGSFKVRGAYNKVARLAENGGPLPHLIACSAGNHAQGVAFAAAASGTKATIVMPCCTSIAKISATEGYGAEVVLHGDCYDDTYEHAVALGQENKYLFVHPFDDEDIIAGQGTISLEILKSLPTVNTVLIPAGGGGLLSGMAACIKQINPSIRVVGVQSEGADALVRSFKSGTLKATETSSTIADGIAIRKPAARTFELIQQYVDEMVTVSDDEIAEAILLLLERSKVIAEPAGAATLAAAIHRKTDLGGKRVVALLSGGNIDVSYIHKIVEKGLIQRGRQMRFQTIIRDAPGGLQHFSAIVASCGASIIMVEHNRLRVNLPIGDAILHVACEVSSRRHGQELITTLEQNGYAVTIES